MRRIGLAAAAIVLFFGLLGGGLWWSERKEARRAALLSEVSRDILDERRALEADDPAPPDAGNAAVLYEGAFKVRREEGWIVLRKLERDWDRPPEDLVDHVRANAEALALVEKAAALDRCRFATDYQLSGGGYLAPVPTGPPAQNGLLRFLDLIHARGRIALAEGRTAGAVEDALRIPRLVRHYLARNLVQLDYLHQVLACEFPERLLRHPGLDAATARRMAKDLLGCEEVFAGAPLHDRFVALYGEGRIWLLLRDDGLSESYEANLRKQFGLSPRGLLGGLGTGDLDLLREVREGLVAMREMAKRLEATTKPPPWIGMLTVVRAAFAVRAFELEKGMAPARLEDLVPEFLPAVPRDPFGSGPLRYEVRADGWSVGSIGKINRFQTSGEWKLVELRIDFPERR